MDNSYGSSRELSNPQIYPDLGDENFDPNNRRQGSINNSRTQPSRLNSLQSQDLNVENSKGEDTAKKDSYSRVSFYTEDDSTTNFIERFGTKSLKRLTPVSIHKQQMDLREMTFAGKLKEPFQRLKENETEWEEFIMKESPKARYSFCWFAAYAYYKFFKPEEAYKMVKRAESILDQFQKELGLVSVDLCSINGMLGNLSYTLKKYDEAREYFTKFLREDKKSSMVILLKMDSLKNVSRIRVLMREDKDELDFLKMMLQERRNLNDELQHAWPPKKSLIVNCCNDIVEICLEKDNLEEAEEFLEEAFKQIKEGGLEDLWFMARCKRNQAKIHIIRGRKAQAIESYKGALEIMKISTPPENFLMLKYEKEYRQLNCEEFSV